MWNSLLKCYPIKLINKDVNKRLWVSRLGRVGFSSILTKLPIPLRSLHSYVRYSFCIFVKKVITKSALHWGLWLSYFVIFPIIWSARFPLTSKRSEEGAAIEISLTSRPGQIPLDTTFSRLPLDTKLVRANKFSPQKKIVSQIMACVRFEKNIGSLKRGNANMFFFY